MHGKAVWVVEDGAPRKVVDVPGTPAGLGWLPDGTLLVAAQQDRVVHRVVDGRLTPHADLSESVPSAINDMWVMPNGQAYVGEMGFDVHAFLAAAEEGRTDGPEFAFARVWLVDTDGSHQPATEAELMFPNGIVPGPKPGTLLVAESFGLRISAFDVAPDGTLSGSRVWAQLDFAPDGIALDGDGNLWVADPAGQRAVLLAEGGAVLSVVPTESRCLSVAVSDSHLYLCTTPETDPHRSVALAASRVELAPL
jgi:sugar lactone lactonase YvrE